MNRFRSAALVAATLAVAPTVASGLSIGQVDTFQSATTAGWQINLLGFGNPPASTLPVVTPTGGPTGPNDAYLLLTALGGAGGGSRLTALNVGQWAGDYLALGIPTVEMDLINFGPGDLAIRLLFEAVGPGGPTDVAITSDVFLLPAGGTWTHAAFSLALADLLPLVGTVEDALSLTTVLRIVHAPAATFPGPPVVAQLGVDNLSAGPVERPGPFTPVPEPAPLGLLLAAACAFAVRRRHASRRCPAGRLRSRAPGCRGVADGT